MLNQFIIQPQQKSEWCWAAVAVSIEKYFNPRSSLTQCEIARRVTGHQNCYAQGPSCNQAETLIKALEEIRRLKRIMNGPASFNEIRQELDAGRPVCARISWQDGYAHFVILVGYEILRSGERHVDIADPWNPSSTVDFDQFQGAYFGDGEWVDTYLVTESSKQN